ncbi:MAG: ATPase [Armatimonadetes bacterium 55-13]|nr:AAA family ATPase [Armatimonadota bacterium]OJU65744.1 MAG: ATPase [Armatimonadetes bacterium 55-13]
MNAAQEIEILIRAKYPILYIVSWEESRVESTLQNVCKGLNRTLHTWSITQGMRPAVNRTSGPVKPTSLPGELEALALVHESSDFTVFLLKDFHPYMRDNRVVRLLRDLALRLRGKAQTLVIMGPSLSLPTDLEKDVTVVDFALPESGEIEKKLDEVIEAVKGNPNVDTKLDPHTREVIVKSAQGLTMDEIESVFARSLVEKKKFDVEIVLEEKKQIIRKSGLLEYYPAQNQMSDVGGMELLKEWLEKRTNSFTDKAREFGIPAPKGVLILGVQGCGKSLIAKAIAAHWALPMLKLDVGRIFGSLVGQSEENIRKAIKVAESVAPCILWADEIEKGFAGASGASVSDSGTTARVFATFLTWMQEKTAPVFLIATANNVSQLPPEMLRKGRFDEIFFVDLPDKAERKQIFEIHLKKRGRDLKKFKTEALAKLTEGFSGAEIEQVIVGALYVAFDAGRDLNQKDLVAEAEAVVPLSVMMREDIQELREWASIRTRPASVHDGD